MLIDRICDRKDGWGYNPADLYRYLLGKPTFETITRVMDYGTEEEMVNALCNYIDVNDYNPTLKDYIRSVKWLEVA